MEYRPFPFPGMGPELRVIWKSSQYTWENLKKVMEDRGWRFSGEWTSPEFDENGDCID